MAWNGLPRNDEAKFWSLVSPEPNTGCWLWLGVYNNHGRPMFRFKEKQQIAARLAYRFATGQQPTGQVNHKCDNKACVNPAHLYNGTAADNTHDWLTRGGLARVPRGERHYAAKLTSAEVAAIRASNGSHRELAAKYGVDPSTISRVQSGARRKAG